MKKAAAVVAILMAIALFIVIFGERPSADSNQKVRPSSAASTSTASDCICAASLDDVVNVLEAYRSRDSEALMGLVGRGKARLLKEGTRLYVAGNYEHQLSVLIESGAESGERCWIDSSFVRSAEAMPSR